MKRYLLAVTTVFALALYCGGGLNEDKVTKMIEELADQLDDAVKSGKNTEAIWPEVCKKHNTTAEEVAKFFKDHPNFNEKYQETMKTVMMKKMPDMLGKEPGNRT